MDLSITFTPGGHPAMINSTPLTGVIVAMDEELSIILQHLEQRESQHLASLEFHRGLFFGKPVVAVVCGVGKVNAALCTQIRSEEHTSELQSRGHLVCRLLLE